MNWILWEFFDLFIYQRNLRSVVSVGVSTECVSRVVWRGRARIGEICSPIILNKIWQVGMAVFRIGEICSSIILNKIWQVGIAVFIGREGTHREPWFLCRRPGDFELWKNWKPKNYLKRSPQALNKKQLAIYSINSHEIQLFLKKKKPSVNHRIAKMYSRMTSKLV